MDAVFDLATTTFLFFGTFLSTHFLLEVLGIPKSKEGNFPPSIRTLPLVGSVPFLPKIDQLPSFVSEKAVELGPIFSFKLWTKNVVVLTGRSSIEEALTQRSFADRPIFYSVKTNNPELRGIVFHSFDSNFKKYHHLSVSILKKFGFGQRIMETRIQSEVEELLAQLKKQNEQPFIPNHLITGSVLNVILSVISGERLEHGSSSLDKLITLAHEFVRNAADIETIGVLPILKYIPKFRNSLVKFIRATDEMKEILDSKIDAARRNELSESFITEFIETEAKSLDRKELLFILQDLFLAGSETSSNTILWSLSILANHPEVQRTLQNEIDSIVTINRFPSLDDRKKLPLTESAILEIMRLKTVLPLGVLHQTSEDTELGSYFIPKETIVIPNLEGTHLDSKLWKDPKIFKFDRFLDANGRFVKSKDVIPFSVGKRSCLGEILAQQEIYLFLSAILQNFDICPPDGQDKIMCKEINSGTKAPSDYQVRFIPRHKQ